MKPVWLLYPCYFEMYFARYKTQLLETMVCFLQSCLEEQGKMEKRMEKGKERERGNERQEWRDGKTADREEREDPLP